MRHTALLVLWSLFSLFGPPARAAFPPAQPWLDYWSFDNTNTWVTYRGYFPVSFTNVSTSDLGEFWTADLDTTNAAWLQYNITESSGTNELKVDRGSLMFWFAPNWSGTNQGGAGPGEWGRLIEVGAYTTNASYGWWSLYTDPAGVNLYFSAQTNDGSGATYLTAPIDWSITNRWHLIALTYSATNSALWIDALLVTNGAPVSYLPGPGVLTNGFFIGSDSSGLSQAHGMFDDLSTYDYEIDGATITNAFQAEGIWYYVNPLNLANIGESAFSYPSLPPSNFDAVTGPGNLIPISTNSIGCETNSQVWLTNFVATMATNHTMSVTFTIAGGADGSLYDVFANSVLDFSTNRALAWSWMGQGHHCTTYMLTNLYSSGSFLILGTPLDSDGDGLTDAYERLVSKTNPYLWDTDGDGVGDGWEVLLGTDPLNYDFPSPLKLPAAGSSYLRILAPDLLEMVLVASDASVWNFVTNDVPTLPPTNQFQVKVSSGLVGVTQVGYKRRALYALYPALDNSDLRIENTLYLRLASTNWATSNAKVEVTTTNTAIWTVTNRFVSVNNGLRFVPTIHVNQEGYLPTYPKMAMLGYFLGSLGEMQISTNLGFKLVSTATGAQVYPASGLAALTPRPDDTNSWWADSNGLHQAQYQSVLEADFSAFTNSGQCQLVVPGLGASFPFWITNAVAMELARTYALGLYHQRCGSGTNGLQVNDANFTRFVHTNCHTAPAYIPMPETNTLFTYTWGLLAGYGEETYTNAESNDNPPQIAPPLTNSASMLFPFPTNLSQIDVSGGHHDAGDYSKYTVNSAQLVHTLIFAADNLLLSNFDNLGLPESTNGIPDILDEARGEADFLRKMQDTNDGGFYFLVYPIDTEYENNQLPGPHTQVVWPKTTAVTADAVAALADIGSSRVFGSYFPSLTNGYMQAALKGWSFLTNAIGQYGKDGCYERITIYGDVFTHDDELAWAAASLFAATGNTNYLAKLENWFPNPGDTNGHNGYSFLWIKDTNSLPTNDTLLAAIKYAPNTNSYIVTNGQTIYTNISGPLQFRIFDSQGTMVVNAYDTNVPSYAYASNKIAAFKIYLNGQYSDPQPGFPSTLDTISAIVGQCHTTWRFGWWRMWEGYGCACRDYAFAVRSGRLSASQIDSNYLAQCESEITNRAADLRLWSTQNAYGTSLSSYEKGSGTDQYGVAYYFGGDRAFDIAVADRIHPDPTNAATMIENFNYQAGCNPLNMSFVTGLGWTRQRVIVDQYAWNNPLAVLPPSGIPVGNIVEGLEPPGFFPYENLQDYAFPPYGSGTTNVFQLYDRWADSYNVIIEFVALNTARGLAAAGYLAASTPLTNQFWQRASGSIVFSNGPPRFGARTAAQLSTAIDLSQAQILWDPGQASWGSLGQDPAFGTSAVFIPTTVGDNRTLQAEAVLPDGRRVFATTNFSVWDPIKGGTTNTLDASTVALYHFDDPSHPFVDATTNHYDLAMSGTVILATNANWMASPTGRVARFQNYGDQLTVTIPRLTFFDTNGNATPVSLEFEIYPRAYKSAPSGYAEIFELAQDYYSYWSCQYASGQNPFIQASGGTNILDSAGWGQYLTPSTWHSIKITTQPGGAAQLFIDGNNVAGPIDTVYFPHYYPSTMPTNNWNWSLTIGNLDGDIDEVRISNIAR